MRTSSLRRLRSVVTSYDRLAPSAEAPCSPACGGGEPLSVNSLRPTAPSTTIQTRSPGSSPVGLLKKRRCRLSPPAAGSMSQGSRRRMEWGNAECRMLNAECRTTELNVAEKPRPNSEASSGYSAFSIQHSAFSILSSRPATSAVPASARGPGHGTA